MIEPSPASTFRPLPLVGAVDDYHAHTIDMVDDAHARDYWLNVFRSHTPGLAELAAASGGNDSDAQDRAAAFAEEFQQIINEIDEDPASHGPLNIGLLCTIRQDLLGRHGFYDPYLDIKQQENETALAILPTLLAELDAMPPAQRMRELIAGVFAGNIFDLGAAETIKLFEAGQVDFHKTREKVRSQRWHVDHSAELEQGLADSSHRRAVLFVDNAGADVVLGMIPFARHLLQSNAHVVLTANTGPALNDITHRELVAMIGRIADFDATLRDALTEGRLTLVPSGNNLPVIDLSAIDPALAAAAVDADLLVLEGMGRALETNYRHRFTCDTLKLAMIKEQHVADVLDGSMYDVVCRFDPAA